MNEDLSFSLKKGTIINKVKISLILLEVNKFHSNSIDNYSIIQYFFLIQLKNLLEVMINNDSLIRIIYLHT